jgi:predicted short-subunit dehydrogenase-like oxidoreductase (DUF2520 family)
MRQVPDRPRSPVGIVGRGRLATHLAHYFTLLGIPIRCWSRRTDAGSPEETLAECPVVLLLISDSAIAPFVGLHPGLQSHTLVHASGSLVTPLAHAAHPLMSFGPALYDLETYRAIPFITDENGPPLGELLPGLPNPRFTIHASARPYYHALCVMAGAFSTMLWQKLFADFEHRLGLPPEAAHPYLRRLSAALLTEPRHALTGPVARGDAGAIQSNLAALEGDPFQAVYEAFVRVYDQRA